jgi:hypothetical protein
LFPSCDSQRLKEMVPSDRGLRVRHRAYPAYARWPIFASLGAKFAERGSAPVRWDWPVRRRNTFAGYYAALRSRVSDRGKIRTGPGCSQSKATKPWPGPREDTGGARRGWAHSRCWWHSNAGGRGPTSARRHIFYEPPGTSSAGPRFSCVRHCVIVAILYRRRRPASDRDYAGSMLRSCAFRRKRPRKEATGNARWSEGGRCAGGIVGWERRWPREAIPSQVRPKLLDRGSAYFGEPPSTHSGT